MKHLNLTALIAILLYFQIEYSEAGLISPVEKPLFETTQNNSQINNKKIKPEPVSNIKEKTKLKPPVNLITKKLSLKNLQ